MFIELLQMALALSLLIIGVLLFVITRLAQQGVVVKLTPPIWRRWAEMKTNSLLRPLTEIATPEID